MSWFRPVKRAAVRIVRSNRFMLIAMLGRLGCDVSDLASSETTALRSLAALLQVAGGHDLILTTAAVSTGEEDTSRQPAKASANWSLADGDQPGRPVAMGSSTGTRSSDCRQSGGSFVTCVHVGAAAILALAGAAPEPLVRCRSAPALPTREDRPPRICPRSACARPRMGCSKP